LELYLIRHTAPQAHKGLCYGRTDLPLIPGFQTEFDQVCAKLDLPFDKLYSSPSQRCKKLAEFLTKDSKAEPEYSDLLMELNFGSWEGKLWSEIPETASAYWMKDFVNEKTPNGESYLDLSERISTFLQIPLESHAHSRIGIVAHAGPIRTILCKLLAIPLERGFYFDVDYGSISKILIEKNEHDSFSKVAYWNR